MLTLIIVTYSCYDGSLNVGPITILSPACQSAIAEVTEIVVAPGLTVAFALVHTLTGEVPYN